MAKRRDPGQRRPRKSRTEPASTADELPNIPEPGDAADQAQRESEIESEERERALRADDDDAARSESMASEPSEADIRVRAYHRFLERGGEHGQHFDDWIAAKQDLKKK
jgi:hypothetical protein